MILRVEIGGLLADGGGAVLNDRDGRLMVVVQSLVMNDAASCWVGGLSDCADLCGLCDNGFCRMFEVIFAIGGLYRCVE